jgi:hypothetical protein
MDDLDFLFQHLELKQLFVLHEKIARQISDKVKELELPELEVARMKHQAFNKPSIIMS